MSNYPITFTFDDGGLDARLKAQEELYIRLQKELEETQKVGRDAFRGMAIEIDKSSQAVKKSLTEIAKSAKDQQAQIGFIAIKIAANTKEAERFQSALKKLEQAKLSGITADIDEIESEFTQLIEKVELTEQEMKFLVDNAQEVGKALSTITSGDLDALANDAEEATTQFKSAKAELREIKNLLNSGSLSGEEFQKAQLRAAELEDRIGDTNERIRNLASDTRGIDTLIEGTRLAAAGFGIVEGAAALFGDENEELQKALVKLNAIMVISNSLQEVHALLLQNSNIKMRLATAGQAAYNLVVGQSSGVLKIFRIALASTGVGLLVIALGALILNFDKVKAKALELVPGLEKIGSVISGVVSSIGSIFSSGFDVIKNLATGNLKGAYEAFRDAGKNAATAFNDGFAENEQEKENERLKASLDATIATQKKKLEILEAQGKDTSALQNKIFDNEKKSLELAGSDKQAIEDKIHEKNVFNAQRAAKLAEEAQKARDKAREEEKKRAEEFAADLDAIGKETLAARRQNDLDALDDGSLQGKIAQLEKRRQFDQEDLKARKDQLLAIAKTAQERADVEKFFNELIIETDRQFLRDKDQINREIVEKEKEARAEFLKIQQEAQAESDKFREEAAKRELEDKLAYFEEGRKRLEAYYETEIDEGNKSLLERERLEREKLQLIIRSYENQRQALLDSGVGLSDAEILDLDALIANLKKQVDAVENPIAGIGKKFKDVLGKALGLDGPETEQFLEGFNALKDAVLDVVRGGFEAELDLIDKTIEERESRIDELETQIDEEKKRKDAGYSNDYDALLKKQADEEALLKADNKKRLDIQKEQLAAETAIQAAQQVGALVTAVANITASGSKLGLLGIPLIAAAIISMFSLYRSYKNQAKALTQQQAFKGGKISDYLNPGETAKSDRPGRGEGHRVEGTNLSIGADEFLVNAVSTSHNLPFLREFNKGKFDAVDLMRLVEMRPNADSMKKVAIGVNANSNAIVNAVDRQTAALINDNNKRPVVIPHPNGDVEIIRYKGINIEREIIRAAG